MNGWCETYDGRSVYTEDFEMYWYADLEQWFHLPNLEIRPYRPGIEGAIGREVDRLSDGWPTLRSALWPWVQDENRHRLPSVRQGVFWNLACWVLRAFIVFAVVFALVHVGDIYYVAVDLSSRSNTEAELDRSAASAAGCWQSVMWLFFALPAFWVLYMCRTSTVDVHKGNVLVAGTIALTAYRRHQAHQQTRDQRMAHDIADQIGRRHHGGPPW